MRAAIVAHLGRGGGAGWPCSRGRRKAKGGETRGASDPADDLTIVFDQTGAGAQFIRDHLDAFNVGVTGISAGIRSICS